MMPMPDAEVDTTAGDVERQVIDDVDADVRALHTLRALATRIVMLVSGLDGAAPPEALAAQIHLALVDGRPTDVVGLHALLVRSSRKGAVSSALRAAALVDLAEAAAQLAAPGPALAAVDELVAELGPDAAERSVELRYARALLAGEDAPDRLQDLVERVVGASPFLAARMQLSLGTSLRRRRRVVDSRAPLGAAVAAFEALGARQWAERAREELRATGVHRRASHQPRTPLTPREALIARMASEGLSNQEIGRRLFLSSRTVSAHLYKVFPKLGVSSRGQLHTVLARAEVSAGA